MINLNEHLRSWMRAHVVDWLDPTEIHSQSLALLLKVVSISKISPVCSAVAAEKRASALSVDSVATGRQSRAHCSVRVASTTHQIEPRMFMVPSVVFGRVRVAGMYRIVQTHQSAYSTEAKND